MRATRSPVVRPLTAHSTRQRLVFLLLGSGLAVAFASLDAVVLGAIAAGRLPLPLAAPVFLAVTVAPPALLGLLPSVRVVEGAAARNLLQVALPESLPAPRDFDARWRAALWFLLHLVAGAVVGAALLAAASWVISLAAAPFAARPLVPGLPTGASAAWLLVLVIPTVLVFGYLVAGVGAAMARIAAPLLGPSPAERLAEVEASAARLAERNRLARELHDSVGHALTVTTLQAGAAGRVLDADPEFARRALAAIEETGRAALADLDHVLGLLREESAPRAPQRTLDDLPALLSASAATGVPVRASVPDRITGVPAVVSREAYRIVQECLTNALRHAGRVPVTLRLRLTADELELELTNRLSTVDAPTRPTGGRGLAGIAERVALLSGTMTAAPTDGDWRVAVRLPLGHAP
ncbi:sensor histidine kinase [Actinocatenispora sera]|uniref:sensor histidine kinase n=1 Tax=Actinocatenispora sera TaxID=390989 RepID=UPI0004C302BF|nr:histidine kinase [Actinocatenispora sera]